MPEFPLPPARGEVVAVPAPGPGAGNWAGAPSAVQEDDGAWVVAYRVRTADGRGVAVVVARSPDGERLTPVGAVAKERFGAESLERPALVRAPGRRWRLYVSCATPGSRHWRIQLLDAADLGGLADADPVTAFPGSPVLAVKDPVIRRHAQGWQAWICCHPLDRQGEEDRMHTRYATSVDGVVWAWRGVSLTGRPGAWDARGARVTAVLPDGRAAYDGRATRQQNFSERTGLAVPADRPGALVAQGDEPMGGMRYLDAVARAEGGYRLYYESPLDDGSHELRTALVDPMS